MSLQITTYWHVKITFCCLGSLQNRVEIVCCHPHFHGKLQYDFLLIKLPNSQFSFARLHYLFCCKAQGRIWCLALVTRCKTNRIPERTDPGLRLVTEEERGIFIDLNSIVRWAYMQSIFDDTQLQTYYVNNLVNYEGDMYLQYRSIPQTDCY